MEEQVNRVNREEIETFLRNAPNPVLLGIFGENCSPCDEMVEEVGKRTLPEGTAFAQTILGNEPADIEIADMLAVEEFPTVIAFCRGEEVGRASDPGDLDSLLDSLRRCRGNVERK